VAQAQLLRVLMGGSKMRKSPVARLLVALGGVGTVLAQTTVDGLDLDAINKAAQAHARNLGQFVDQVLGHQAEANADLAEDVEALVERSQAKVKAEAAARAKAPTGDAVDLDALVADAGRSMAPSPHSAPMLIAFASLSMPPESLKRMIADVSKAGGMVVFGGSRPVAPSPSWPRCMRPSAIRPAPMSASIRGFSVPMASRRCPPMSRHRPASTSAQARTAPAATPYDRIAGNVTTHFALETIAQGHGPGAPVAKAALANLERTP
jgi:conjugal transfer pilus assembly protein TrbC